MVRNRWRTRLVILRLFSIMLLIIISLGFNGLGHSCENKCKAIQTISFKVRVKVFINDIKYVYLLAFNAKLAILLLETSFIKCNWCKSSSITSNESKLLF